MSDMRRALLFCAAIAFAIACGDNVTEPIPDRSTGTPKVLFATSSTDDGLTISTDKDDYAPGETVLFTGAGWPANDVLDILLVDDLQDTLRWSVTTTGDGTFEDATYVVNEADIGVTFTLTATSRSTGATLTVQFTDGTISNATIEMRNSPACSTAQPSGTVNSPICAHSSFTIAGSGATAAQFRWKSPGASGTIVLISQRSPNFPNGTAGTQTYDASFTPSSAGTWTVLLCEGNNADLAPAGQPQCQAGMQRATQTFTVNPASTTTELISSPNPSTPGQSVTFTATVKDQNTNPIGNKGSVTFYEFTGTQTCDALGGATPLAGPIGLSANPSGGQASFSTTTLSDGTHVITACYSGTADLIKSFGSVSQTVAPVVIPTSLTVAAATGTYGGQATLSATLTRTATGAAVSGKSITFRLNGTEVGSALTNGSGIATLLVYLTNNGTAAGTFIDANTYPAGASSGVGASFAGESPLVSSEGSADLTISARPITVKANNAGSITYGDALPTFGYTLVTGSFVGSDEAAFAATLSYLLSGTPNSDGFYDAGTHTITPTWTYNNTNYSISLASPGTGGLNIQPRPILVKANNAGPIFYGDAVPAFGYTLTGNFIGSDETAFAATLSYALSGAPNSDGFRDAGSYTITPSWTYDNDNYAISLATPGTGTLTISPRPITVTANDLGPIYYGDAVPAFGYTLTGNFIANDGTAFAATLSFTLSGANNGDGHRNAGAYTITPSWTYANTNYALTPAAGTLTINKRPITIKANNIAGPIYYGEPIPAFTWSIVTGSFIASDQTAFGSVVTFQVSSPGSPLPVGSHTITPVWSVTGLWTAEKEGNYAITAQTGNITILEWRIAGFYAPVDVPAGATPYNLIKGGSTVPLKFEVFAGTRELTDPSTTVKLQPDGFRATQVTCPSAPVIDDIEFTTTGGTVLRYDATAGQFIQNWQTPKKPNTCYKTTMTTQDGSSIYAFFWLK
jgi:hypothetical protein